jgi:hypothetical protein
MLLSAMPSMPLPGTFTWIDEERVPAADRDWLARATLHVQPLSLQLEAIRGILSLLVMDSRFFPSCTRTFDRRQSLAGNVVLVESNDLFLGKSRLKAGIHDGISFGVFALLANFSRD